MDIFCLTAGTGVFQQQGINRGLFNQPQPVTSISGLFNPTVMSTIENQTNIEEKKLVNWQQDTQLQQQLQTLINSPFNESHLSYSSTKASVTMHKMICYPQQVAAASTLLPPIPQLPTTWTISRTMDSQTTTSSSWFRQQQQPISSSISSIFNTTDKSASGNNTSGVQSKSFNHQQGEGDKSLLAACQQEVQLEQQLQVLARSPFGDSPLFRTTGEVKSSLYIN